MRIGFDAKRLYNNFTGLGNYSRNLVLNLAEFAKKNEYFLYTPKIKEDPETTAILNNPKLETRLPNSSLKLLWRTVGINKQLKKDGIEIYHGLSNEIPLGSNEIKKVVTIHDLIFKIYPETYKPADRLIYDQKFSYAARNADKIVAISETTKSDIIKYYGIAEEKIQVIYQSAHPLFYQQQTAAELAEIKRKYELPDRFILSVGSVTERKNLMLVAEALKVLRGRTDIPLVVVGAGKDYKRKVENYLLSENLHGKVRWYSNLKDNKDLQAIYQLATVFVYPSLYEGFGIPLIESLLSGTPVITSNCSCLPEAAGPHAELIDPNSPADMAAAIYRLTENQGLLKERSEKGLKYALKKYDRKALSSQVIQLYQSL